ncbi:MAG: hypothetical protein KC414_05635 [Romboutsia sp.]|nr:hypothetical protein [Romboutsia sp.]
MNEILVTTKVKAPKEKDLLEYIIKFLHEKGFEDLDVRIWIRPRNEDRPSIDIDYNSFTSDENAYVDSVNNAAELFNTTGYEIIKEIENGKNDRNN